jgi:FLYWCH zinc finger domain
MQNESSELSDEIDDKGTKEYSYHRHSEEKNMIYFRCSDKKCKARVLFNKSTYTFSFKNNHLSPSRHKPNSSKAISAHQINKILFFVKGPISLVETPEPSGINGINKTDKRILPISSPENLLKDQHIIYTLLKFPVDDETQAEKFCEHLISLDLALSAKVKKQDKKMKLFPETEARKSVVEVKAVEQFTNQIRLLAKNFFQDLNIESFRRL